MPLLAGVQRQRREPQSSTLVTISLPSVVMSRHPEHTKSETERKSMEEALKASVALTEQRYSMNPDLCVLGEKWIPGEDEERGIGSPICTRSGHRLECDGRRPGNRSVTPDLGTRHQCDRLRVRERFPIRMPSVSGSAGRRVDDVDIYDSCIAIPRMKRAGHLETSGRGLAIVQDLSHTWGWTLNAYGKSVWFQLVAWP